MHVVDVESDGGQLELECESSADEGGCAAGLVASASGTVVAVPSDQRITRLTT
jgi:hypothetical protein